MAESVVGHVGESVLPAIFKQVVSLRFNEAGNKACLSLGCVNLPPSQEVESRNLGRVFLHRVGSRKQECGATYLL